MPCFKLKLTFVFFRVKLAQLWNTVPKNEKLTWSRKARTLLQKNSRLSKVCNIYYYFIAVQIFHMKCIQLILSFGPSIIQKKYFFTFMKVLRFLPFMLMYVLFSLLLPMTTEHFFHVHFVRLS